MPATVCFASTLGRLQAPVRTCDWPDLERVLPDGGLPQGIVEITSAHRAFAGATSVVVAAVRAVHARDARLWCAWIDSASTLYAPGLARAGIDLRRLLVVRPEPKHLPRVIVKVASAGAFDVVVVDLPKTAPRVDRLVRKLALAAEQHGSTIVLLAPPHVDPWPVALRLEIARTRQGIDVRVTKDRHGRSSPGLTKAHVPLKRTA
jgi:hypothetical protein